LLLILRFFLEAMNIQQPTLNIQWPNEEMKKSDGRIAALSSNVEKALKNHAR